MLLLTRPRAPRPRGAAGSDHATRTGCTPRRQHARAGERDSDSIGAGELHDDTLCGQVDSGPARAQRPAGFESPVGRPVGDVLWHLIAELAYREIADLAEHEGLDLATAREPLASQAIERRADAPNHHRQLLCLAEQRTDRLRLCERQATGESHARAVCLEHAARLPGNGRFEQRARLHLGEHLGKQRANPWVEPVLRVQRPKPA